MSSQNVIKAVGSVMFRDDDDGDDDDGGSGDGGGDVDEATTSGNKLWIIKLQEYLSLSLSMVVHSCAHSPTRDT